MVLPISCNECRRRKIRCDRVQPCKKCAARGVQCTYPHKFRSIDVSKLSEGSTPRHVKVNENVEVSADPGDIQSRMQRRIQELEEKLAISEDLISIFDSVDTPPTGETPNGVNTLDLAMTTSIDPSLKGKDSKDARLLKKARELPVLLQNSMANLLMIRSALTGFFDLADRRDYFKHLLNRNTVVAYLEKGREKTLRDDEMMVLLSVMIDKLKDSHFDTRRSTMDSEQLRLKSLINSYFQLSKVQEHESVEMIQSQVIMIHYFCYIMDFTKAWKLLSQAVANAYALGLYLTQDMTWLKLCLMESLLCLFLGRPNLINGLHKQHALNEDLLKEYDFISIVRDWNTLSIDCTLKNNEVEVNYTDIINLDTRFDTLTRHLRMVLDSGLATREKCLVVLNMALGLQMKMHSAHLQRDTFSGVKMVSLIPQYLETIEMAFPRGIFQMRQAFVWLDCLLYQFTLIFIRFLNHSLSQQKVMDMDEINLLGHFQRVLIALFDKDREDGHKNVMLTGRLDTVQVIKSIDLNRVQLVDEAGKVYVKELKRVLEDEDAWRVLSDVSA